MASPEYLTRADLDKLVGASRVTQLTDDDHDGVADSATLDEIMAQAEGFAASMLLRGFANDQIATLAANDAFFVSQVAWVACEFASERKGEFAAEDGKGRYWAQFERAEKFFERLSKSQIQSKGEAAAGQNKQTGGTVRPKDSSGQNPNFVFASDDDAPTGRGGY